ncbi:MAG TPA: response regulator, partial [Spirochaetota bacterium]|nr:response regulator [Spirochaetota bacterium]
MGRMIKVLVVDDSSVVRQTMTEILESDPSIEVIDTASDPYIAVDKIRKVKPDVITLDVEMPRMDGVTFLHKIMSQHPIPVVMCSSLTEDGAETTLRALEYGAVDIITKPKIGVQRFLEESQIRICDSVKAASQAKLSLLPAGKTHREPSKKLTADAMLAPPTGKAMIRTTEKIVAVGASTGGTEALRIFLEGMPSDAPGIAVVQH